jgi:predicted RNA-binding protein
MCEARAYLINDKEEELILENVDQLEREGDTIRMINLFGEQKVIDAQIKMISFVDNRIVLERTKK